MKPLKDYPMINYIKLKWSQYPLVITVLGMLFAAMIYFAVSFVIHSVKYKPKEGDVVILGENGGMRLAKPEDVDEMDLEIGMIISSDDSTYFTAFGRVRDINTSEYE